MSAVDEIQAAIDKLTILQAGSVVGPWEVRDGSIVRDALGLRTIQDVWVADIDEVSADADLIVTLHRTIDAQLAILNVMRDHVLRPDHIFKGPGADLVRAINGGTA